MYLWNNVTPCLVMFYVNFWKRDHWARAKTLRVLPSIDFSIV